METVRCAVHIVRYGRLLNLHAHRLVQANSSEICIVNSIAVDAHVRRPLSIVLVHHDSATDVLLEMTATSNQVRFKRNILRTLGDMDTVTTAVNGNATHNRAAVHPRELESVLDARVGNTIFDRDVICLRYYRAVGVNCKRRKRTRKVSFNAQAQHSKRIDMAHNLQP